MYAKEVFGDGSGYATAVADLHDGVDLVGWDGFFDAEDAEGAERAGDEPAGEVVYTLKVYDVAFAFFRLLKAKLFG